MPVCECEWIWVGVGLSGRVSENLSASEWGWVSLSVHKWVWVSVSQCEWVWVSLSERYNHGNYMGVLCNTL